MISASYAMQIKYSFICKLAWHARSDSMRHFSVTIYIFCHLRVVGMQAACQPCRVQEKKNGKRAMAGSSRARPRMSMVSLTRN